MFAALAWQPSTAPAGVAAETNDLIAFEYQQTGANEEEAVRLACLRAVHASIGRLLCSDYGLQGRDLLVPYVQKNWQKYVASSYVLERRFERDGFGCRIRVQTYPQVLHRDLRDKRFLYKPRRTPYHCVFVSQTFDGQPSESDAGRRAIIDTILAQGGKVFESGIQSPPPTADVLENPAVFAAACEASQRIGAEILVAARVDTKSIDQRELLYDKIATFESTIHIEFVRADDGSKLGEMDVVERGSDSDAAAARDESIYNALSGASETLYKQGTRFWRAMVLDQCRFSILLTDATPEETEMFARYLEAHLRAGTKVGLKSHFSNVSVLSVNTERDYSMLERVINGYNGLNLRITDRMGKRITAEARR